jgi:hypothetical protein
LTSGRLAPGLWRSSVGSVDSQDDLSPLVRLACEHFMGGSRGGKREYIADVR